MLDRTTSRHEAVRDQINCAIKAYFLWDDLVSAITLAGAAERVLSDLQPQDGLLGVDGFSLRAAINLYIKDENHKEVAKLFRNDYDFFRHADKNRSLSHTYSTEAVDCLILFAVGAFEFSGYVKTVDMKAFVYWFIAEYPALVKVGSNLTSKVQFIHEFPSKRDFYTTFVAASETDTLR